MQPIYLLIDGQQSGPYSLAQVQQLQAEGKVSGQTLAWKEGMKDWMTLDTLLPSVRPEGTPPPFVKPLPPVPATAVPVRKGMNGCLLAAIIVGALFGGLFVISCLAGIALGPITNGIKKAKENMTMQRARQIDLMLFQYSVDHNGAYPEGKTSTEVFQKLLDGKYTSDPATFYFAMPGKVQPVSNKLTSENVCYDVTSGLGPDSPGTVPVVFSTGYTVSYSSDGGATHNVGTQLPFPGIAVAYKDNSALFLRSAPDGSVPGFIPATFNPGTQTYQQLTP
jgi:hypothetical protein